MGERRDGSVLIVPRRTRSLRKGLWLAGMEVVWHQRGVLHIHKERMQSSCDRI